MKHKVVFFDKATAYYVNDLLQCCLSEDEDLDDKFLEGFRVAVLYKVLEYNCTDMSLCQLVNEGALPPLYFRKVKTSPLSYKNN